VQDPPFQRRKHAVWQRLWASLTIQGTDQAWIACCFNESSRRVCYAINGHPARFEIRADNSRFHDVLAPLVARSRAQGLRKSYRNFFSGSSFCLGGIPALFFRDGCVIGLSGLFRPPWIPLGIGVDTSVLEIASLDLGSGRIMGDSNSGILGDGGYLWSFYLWLEELPVLEHSLCCMTRKTAKEGINWRRRVWLRWANGCRWRFRVSTLQASCPKRPQGSANSPRTRK